MLHIYIAGPFGARCLLQNRYNVLMAEMAGACVALSGHVPIIPHANTASFLDLLQARGHRTPEEDLEFWYKATASMQARCDAALFLPNWKTSKGATEEFEWAVQNEQPTAVLPRLQPNGDIYPPTADWPPSKWVDEVITWTTRVEDTKAKGAGHGI